MVVSMEFERLAYDTALRALDKQERLLDELRGRTGVLLAASALAASFLGRDAFQDPGTVPAIVALAAFVASIAASVFILVPKEGQFVFSASGPALYEGLYEFRGDLPEVYRRLAYQLLAYFESNDRLLRPMTRVFRCAAAALVVQILALVVLVSDTIF